MTIPTPGVPAVPGSAPQDTSEGVNWAELMVQAGKEMEPVPKGSYDAYVDSADATQTQTGKLMYKLKLKIDGGPSNGRILWNNITLTTDNPMALAMFFRNMDAFGLGKEFFATNPQPDVVAEQLIGRRVRVVIDHRLYQGQVRENVKQLLKPQGVAAIAGMQVAGGASVPGGLATPGVPPVSAPVVAPPVAAPVPQPAPAPVSAPAPAPTPEPVPAPASNVPPGMDPAAYEAFLAFQASQSATPAPPAPTPSEEAPPTPEVAPPVVPAAQGNTPAPPPVPF